MSLIDTNRNDEAKIVKSALLEKASFYSESLIKASVFNNGEITQG